MIINLNKIVTARVPIP